MRLTYDPHADALALTISSAEIAETVEAAPDVMLDFDASGGIVAIEVLGVSLRPGAEPLALAFEILGAGSVREVDERELNGRAEKRAAPALTTGS
jgi:uncharacterized protein YuzE